MKSRRRIAFLKAWDHANSIDDYTRDLRLTKWGSGVILQAILSRSRPLWVISGHREKCSTGKTLREPAEKRFYMATPQAMRAPPPPSGAGWSE
jgi:hypothetical protein